MECCGGGSLQPRYEAGPLPLWEVRKITTDVALGLQALHARGMLHRDIKPGNLLRDDNGTTKLGDFGLVTDNIILGYASQNGYLDHVAYEVWGGAGTSRRTDIWALAMTMYRLLHGAEWYSRSPAPKAIIQDGGFADTLNWLPCVPKPWRRLIRTCLNDDPDERFASADQFISALGKLPIEPRWKCSVTPTVAKWERRTDARRFKVEWTKHGARSYTWSAVSEPVGAGKRRSLGGSSKQIGRAQSDRELRAFFATQT
jgi:serine/threonine-protein kinase